MEGLSQGNLRLCSRYKKSCCEGRSISRARMAYACAFGRWLCYGTICTYVCMITTSILKLSIYFSIVIKVETQNIVCMCIYLHESIFNIERHYMYTYHSDLIETHFEPSVITQVLTHAYSKVSTSMPQSNLDGISRTSVSNTV